MKARRNLSLAILALVALMLAAPLGAQEARFALVIGNAEYPGLSPLKNPVNDAQDMAATLRGLGFSVDLLTNADLTAMDEAVVRLGSRLSASTGSVGLFFFAGHGVQSGGVNYLLPSQVSIPSESFLKTRALAASAVLDTLKQSGNRLNVVILDACRDNPFSWGRGGGRGLSVMQFQPSDSIVAYATSAGSVAQDGQGRNGTYTAELLKQLKSPGLDIAEVFRRTGAAVKAVTNGAQVPAIYNQFFGNFVFGGSAPTAPVETVRGSSTAPVVSSARGGIEVRTIQAGELFLDGLRQDNLRAGGSRSLSGLETGNYRLEMRYADGQTETLQVEVRKDQMTPVSFVQQPQIPGMVRIEGGTFMMGSPAGEVGRGDGEVQHRVTVSTFYMGKYEVKQAEYEKLMGYNPSYYKGANLPVEYVSWYDAVAYCNALSKAEGLTPYYTLSGVEKDGQSIKKAEVSYNRTANGYRLLTEAEWEYACRAGTTTPFATGGNVTTSQANYNGNLPYAGNATGENRQKTTPAGSFAANAWGLHDMHGNVWEWCQDWYGAYENRAQTDPGGAASGSNRVLRGGSYFNSAPFLRSAVRSSLTPDFRSGNIGFRVVRQY